MACGIHLSIHPYKGPLTYPNLRTAYKDVRDRAQDPPEHSIDLAPFSGLEDRAAVEFMKFRTGIESALRRVLFGYCTEAVSAGGCLFVLLLAD